MPAVVQPQTPRAMRAQLKRGLLEVTIEEALLDPESLFGFAERRNPKRAFLFVSRVLGRHIPVRPAQMRNAFEALSTHLPSDLPGPILVMGLAETAVGLGAGVHRSLQRSRPDSLYLTSTRHPLGTPLFARFEEEHSHASAHLIHCPTDPEYLRLLENARTLILVDDEASTGKTFINLYTALQQAGLRQIERVLAVTLTDWSQGAVQRQLGCAGSAHSLVRGSYRFTETPDAPLPEMPVVDSVAAAAWPLDPAHDWGRLGTRTHQDVLAPQLDWRPGERILVLGTGEFVWPPFLLAERLECQGADVHFSATTRSPIALGHAIQHSLAFMDNYGLGIPNFLYNVAPGQFDRVLLCSETPAIAIDAHLRHSLKPEIITHGH